MRRCSARGIELTNLFTASLLAAFVGGCDPTADLVMMAPPALPENGGEFRIVNVADANGDNLSDTIWSDGAGRRCVVVLMCGTRVLAAGHALPGPPGEGWRAVTTSDFNRDGMTDLIWTKPGHTTVWLLQGAALLAPGPDLIGPGKGWVTATASDTNNDGMADLLWHDPATNRVAVGLMNGARTLQIGPEIQGPEGDGWEIGAIADTNADGLADIIWENPDRGIMIVWLLDGTRLLAVGQEIPTPPGDGWTIVAAGDFNFDGYFDALWSNAGRGTMAVWLLAGTHLLAAGPEIAGPPGEGWAVMRAGDTNGDGMADAVWQSSANGRFAVWLMAGTRLLAPGPENLGPTCTESPFGPCDTGPLSP